MWVSAAQVRCIFTEDKEAVFDCEDVVNQREMATTSRLAVESAEHAPALRAMDGRFLDLLQPFRQLMYYHPDFNGSFSIKSVLPALFPDDLALSYQGLDIHAGDMASLIYAGLDQVDDADERNRNRESLLAYCKLDTLAMVMIWQELHRVISMQASG